MLLMLALSIGTCHPKKSQKRSRPNLLHKKKSPPISVPIQTAQKSRDLEQTAPHHPGTTHKEGAIKETDNNNIIHLPTIYLERLADEKSLMRNLNTNQDPIVNTVEGGSHTSHFLKGLEPRHTAYYFEEIPIPYTLSSCTSRLEKLPTMVTKGTGLGGAMVHTLSQKKFQSTMGISTNGGMQRRLNVHGKKNNHFFTGALAYDNDGGFDRTPSRYRQSGIKERVASIEGVFQTGHQDAEQKFTISSANQYLQNTYDDLYDSHPAPSKQEYERFFNLFGISYERKNWQAFTALHTTKTFSPGTPAQTIVLTAGAYRTEKDHNFGVFTQQINNHKVYRYDVYCGKKIGPFYPSLRVIKTERQILCPFEVTAQLAKPIKIICGSTYHLPNEYQRFDPQYGNFDLKPEHNYHCHVVHAWKKSNWTVEQTLFINQVTDIIDFVGFNKAYQNRGTLNSVGIDQSIGYDGFDRYKIGCAHTYCVIDGSESAVRRPAWKFLIWQRFFLTEDCFVDLRTHFNGPYLDSDRMEYEKYLKMPSVFLLDVSSTHILNKNWTVLCEVKNLTNHQYESPSGYRAKGIEAWVRLVYTM